MEYVSGVLTGLLATAGLFWLILTILVVGLWALSENERGGWALLFTVALGVLINAKWPQATDWLVDNWLIAIVGYVALAITWTITKWYLHSRKIREAFLAVKKEFLKDKNLPADYFTKEDHPDALLIRSQFAGFLRNASSKLGTRVNAYDHTSIKDMVDQIIPKADDSKARLFIWGVYWPFSVLWFILRDLVTTAAEYVYERIGGRLQKISNQLFKDVL